jgi:RNA polymerase sigma-70 factor (sigma-E family)
MDAESEKDFAEYLRVRGKALLRLSYCLIGDRQRADDVCQAAFLRLYRVWPRIREYEDVDAYARRVVTNEAHRWWRRPSAREDLPGEVAPPAADGFAAVDARDELWRLLMTLSRRQRAVVVLRYVEDLSEEDTADLLGCSVGTVKSTASKAMARLRLAAAPHLGGVS